MHIAPFLWTKTDNLARLKPTVEEQVCQPLLAFVGKHLLKRLPHFIAFDSVFRLKFSYFTYSRVT